MDTQLVEMLLHYIDLRFDELKSILYHESAGTRDWYATKIHNEREVMLEYAQRMQGDSK